MVSKIAITISGAVSLGTFESGSLWELLNVFAKHNELNSPRNVQQYPLIQVDVLSGASAGGMSCAVAANKLAFDADALTDPNDNSLYKAWVTDADIFKMLPSDNPFYSILSSKYISNIANQSIMLRYDKSGRPLKTAKPHLAAAPEISLGLALSNLTGVDYAIPLRVGGSFVYSDFADEYTLANINVRTDRGDLWQEVCAAAVACGAFPFAFRVQELTRQASDYPTDAKVPPTEGKFAFTDGGLFQNEPLGMAINLAQDIDSKSSDNNERYYFYIAPGPKTSTIGRPFRASDATFMRLGSRLIDCIYNQSRFHDWVTAHDTNEQILNFQDAVNTLAPLLMPSGENDLRRMQHVNAMLDALPDGADPKHVQIVSNFLSASGLKNTDGSVKEYLYIYGITATDNELQGSACAAFKGFLKESFRQHDYAVGRLKARQLLFSLADPNSKEPLKIDPRALPSEEDTEELSNFVAMQPAPLPVSEGNKILQHFTSFLEDIEDWVVGDAEKSFAKLFAKNIMHELIEHAQEKQQPVTNQVRSNLHI